MAQIDILQEVLGYSLRKYDHEIIGSNIFYLFNNERYAKAELKQRLNKNAFDGVTIRYISKLSGEIDHCDILFKDVFEDQKNATVDIDTSSNTFEYVWFQRTHPTQRDLNRLALHIDRYIEIIGDFGSRAADYMNPSGVISAAAVVDTISHQQIGFGYNPEKEDTSELEQYVFENEASAPAKESFVNSTSENEVRAYADEVIIDAEAMEEGTVYKAEDAIGSLDAAEMEENAYKNESFTSVIDVDAQEMDIPTYSNPSYKEENLFERKETVKKGFLGGIFRSNKDKRFSDTSELKPVKSSNYSRNADINSSNRAFASWRIGSVDEASIVATLVEFEKDSYRLEINGNGRMQDFKKIPWDKFSNKITEIVISDGISNIGNNAFKSLYLVNEISLPDSIVEIGMSSFEFCSSLKNMKWSKNLAVIGQFAFAGTDSLLDVVLPDSVKEIHDFAFDLNEGFTISCNNPESLVLGAGFHVSDFKRTSSTSSSAFSARNYM